MERRDFLRTALGIGAGVAAVAVFAASAHAAPLVPQPLADPARSPLKPETQPAVTNTEEVEELKPEEVHWRDRWHRRHWRRRWRRHHRAWRRRHWRRHYWRRRYG